MIATTPDSIHAAIEANDGTEVEIYNDGEYLCTTQLFRHGGGWRFRYGAVIVTVDLCDITKVCRSHPIDQVYMKDLL